MRNISVPLLIIGGLPLGACQYAGLAPGLAEVIHGASGERRHADEDFGRAAAEACRGRAARHGRVDIGTVEAEGVGIMRVTGTIEDPYKVQDRRFVCLYRSDGRIADFDAAPQVTAPRGR